MEYGLGGSPRLGDVCPTTNIEKDEMKIIAVTGWRYHADIKFIHRSMNNVLSLYGFETRVHVGDATGADEIIQNWCTANGIDFDVYHARRYPSGALMPGAGPERNRKILTTEKHVDPSTRELTFRPKLADLLVGFPEPGVSPKMPGSGSWGCIGEAFRLGIEVTIPGIGTTT